MRDKKKMKRQDQYEKIWGDKRQKTNAETRCKPKKKGLPDRDKKNGEMRRQTKKNGETRHETKKMERHDMR